MTVINFLRSSFTGTIKRLYSTPPGLTILPESFQSVKYWTEDRVARVMLNRPQRLNAIDEHMPFELESAIKLANWDPSVRVILLYGAGNAFCAGYDLKRFAELEADDQIWMQQEMPWDPAKDYRVMNACTSAFMEIWRSMKPVVAKVKRVGIGGGSDMTLACDITFIEDTAQFGYPRVWGCPTTAFWFYRLGLEKSKRVLLTGQRLSGKEAVELGLLGESCTATEIDSRVDTFIEKMLTIPANHHWFQKQMINHAVEEMGLLSTQRLATIFDGMARHCPEGVAFQQYAKAVGFKQAVKERDSGNETPWSDMR